MKNKEKLDEVAFSEHSLCASICRDSFYEFVKEFWYVLWPDPYKDNWHIEYLCDEAQIVCERMFKGLPRLYDLIINVAPGSTKSTIFSIMLHAWVWTRKPEAVIIGGSYSSPLSLDLALFTRDIIVSDKYQLTFPYVRLRREQTAKSSFMNTKRGMRIATSVGGTITGKHGHLLTIDDPVDPELANSEVALETANKWMGDTLKSRKKDKEVTPTILIMQRLHQNDPTVVMIERAKEAQRYETMQTNKKAPLRIKHICIPAEISDKVRPAYLKSYYRNGLMDPVRLPWSVLNENKVLEYMYAGQYMQYPVPIGGGMFKHNRIKLDIPDGKWIIRVRFWDKAGTAGGRGAFTVGLLMGWDRNKRFWILDVIRGRYSTEVRESIIEQTAAIDGRKVIIGVEQEPGSGGKESAENTVKALAGYIVKIDKPSGAGSSKILRAEPYSVQVNSSNVSMVEGDWNRAYLNEMEFFPDSTYKDQIDASSGAFNIINKRKPKIGRF